MVEVVVEEEVVEEAEADSTTSATSTITRATRKWTTRVEVTLIRALAATASVPKRLGPLR